MLCEGLQKHHTYTRFFLSSVSLVLSVMFIKARVVECFALNPYCNSLYMQLYFSRKKVIN